MLTALERELALTTAWARERREESGWVGCVYFSNVTAKARTRGARLVCRITSESCSEVGVGRAREVSIAAGDGGSVEGAGLDFLAGDGDGASVEERFFERRFAVERIFWAVLESGKILVRAERSDLDSWSGLGNR